MELTLEFRQIQCSCGLVFAIPEDWAQRKEENHSNFYCPACQRRMWYPQESDKEKFKRLYESERQCCIRAHETAEELEDRIRREKQRFFGLKGHLAKMKREGGRP